MVTLLQAENLVVNFSTYFGPRNVLDIEDLSLDEGESFGLVGESGAGKSVFAMTVLRLLPSPPASISGRLLFRQEDLLQKRDSEMKRIRGREIAMIFQDPMSSLNPVFTVRQQMLRVIRSNRGVGRREALRLAKAMMEPVELSDTDQFISKYPHELSGGQRQRIVIAMALSCGATLLIADEPTRNLDVTIQAGILKLVAGLKKEFGTTLLFIANNLGLVSVMCDRVAILLKGQVVEIGPVTEITENPAHPYTRMLLETAKSGRAVAYTPAVGPREEGVSTGCRFAGRCTQEMPSCGHEKPQLRRMDGSHWVACGTLQFREPR